MRAHVFLRMLAYYLEWHLRRRWAPLLFAEEDSALRPDGPVGPAARGAAAEAKERTRRTPDGLPVQSFPDLLGSLGGLTAVELEYAQGPGYPVPTLSEPTPLQRRAFELLGAEPHPAPAPSGLPAPEVGT